MATRLKIKELKLHTTGHETGMFAEVIVQIVPGLVPGGPPMDVIEVLTVVPVSKSSDTIEQISRAAVENAAKTVRMGASVADAELMQALEKSQTQRED